ncbi:hypothetical protein [Mesorhizobium sp. ISC15]|uniref:hypothetical protein n=1 Tax=Mesorhizobium sp. ISC15 TaxID=3076429 RepID=UPI00301C741F
MLARRVLPLAKRELVARLDHPALELGDQRRAPLLAHGEALGRRRALKCGGLYQVYPARFAKGGQGFR